MDLYFKAVKEGGVSAFDAKFVYPMREGAEVEVFGPEPKKPETCGNGLHLAKSLPDAFRYVPDAAEVWFAERLGDLLSEDKSKLRTNRIRMVRKLTKDDFANMVASDPKLGKWSGLFGKALAGLGALALEAELVVSTRGDSTLAKMIYLAHNIHGIDTRVLEGLLTRAVKSDPAQAKWAYYFARFVGASSSFWFLLQEAAKADRGQEKWFTYFVRNALDSLINRKHGLKVPVRSFSHYL